MASASVKASATPPRLEEGVAVVAATNRGELLRKFHELINDYRQRVLDVKARLCEAESEGQVEKKLNESRMSDDIRLKYEVLQELRDICCICNKVFGDFANYEGDPELIKPMTQVALSLLRSLERANTIYTNSLDESQWQYRFLTFIAKWGSIATWKEHRKKLLALAVGGVIIGGIVTVGVIAFGPLMLIPGLLLLVGGGIRLLRYRSREKQIKEIDRRVLRELRGFINAEKDKSLELSKENLQQVLEQMKRIEQVGLDHWQYREDQKDLHECSICLSAAATSRSLCMPAGCTHVFHTECLRQWNKGKGAGCPNCRKPYIYIFELTVKPKVAQ